MNEIQFLTDLLLKDIPSDLKEMIASRIKELAAVPMSVSTITLYPEQCNHEYPNPWFATVPPHCKKCGKQAIPYVVTSNSNFTIDGITKQ